MSHSSLEILILIYLFIFIRILDQKRVHWTSKFNTRKMTQFKKVVAEFEDSFVEVSDFWSTRLNQHVQGRWRVCVSSLIATRL